jgi:hypothetical protein
MATTKELEELKNRIGELEKELKENKVAKKKAKKEESMPIHDVYTWHAPDRVYTERTSTWYIVVAFVACFSIVVAFLLGNWPSILAICAIIILVYVLNVIPPNTIKLAVTNRGIRIEEELFLWNDIEYFWVSERSGQLVLNIHLLNQAGRVVALIGSGDVNKILKEIIKHEEYREPRGMEGLISSLLEGRRKRLTDFLETDKKSSHKKE